MKSNKALIILIVLLVAGAAAWYLMKEDEETPSKAIPVAVAPKQEPKVLEEKVVEPMEEEEASEPSEEEEAEIDPLQMLEFISSKAFSEFAELQWDEKEIKRLLTSAATYHTEKLTQSNPLEIMMQKQAGFNELDEGIKVRKESIDRGEAPTPLSEASYDALGLVLAMNSPALAWPLSLDEKTAFMRGIQIALSGKNSPYTFTDEQVKTFIEMMNNKVKERMRKEAQSKKADNQEYLDNLKDAQQDPSGFYYEIQEEGQGDKPSPTNEVTVHYHGTLTNGTVFDSSVERGKPATFRMNQVIPAFSGGLSKIGAGGKVRIYAPPELAYGDQGIGSIPPGSILIFDCELISIQ